MKSSPLGKAGEGVAIGEKCELCTPRSVLSENALAYARLDSNSLSPGHVLVVPRRHVADFFDMTPQEQAAIFELLGKARQLIHARHSPDGYNIGVNIGPAAGQSRMHVHVHLIPRHLGDVADPKGGIRCVLAGKRVADDALEVTAAGDSGRSSEI
jgi:diadenosine tetraphosphate (Ap4A) HIT family hydrolase